MSEALGENIEALQRRRDEVMDTIRLWYEEMQKLDEHRERTRMNIDTAEHDCALLNQAIEILQDQGVKVGVMPKDSMRPRGTMPSPEYYDGKMNRPEGMRER